jgi:hypothetical protein
MRTRSFRVAPADDDELLAVEPFGLAPQAAVSRRVRRMERLRHHALKTELARVLQDEFAVARLMAIELKAELARHQRLEQRLALDERQPCGVLAIDVQEVEGVIDERRAALAICRSLGEGEARQSSLVNAAELAFKIGSLHVHTGERRNGARIFVAPVEPGPGQKLHAAIIEARGHAKAVQFDFMQPLRPRRRLLDRLGKLRRDEGRKGGVAGVGLGERISWSTSPDGGPNLATLNSTPLSTDVLDKGWTDAQDSPINPINYLILLARPTGIEPVFSP